VTTYQIQIWSPRSVRAENEFHFSDFHALRDFAVSILANMPEKILAIHLPARSSDHERKQLRMMGAIAA
jgi:hypothetical protein